MRNIKKYIPKKIISEGEYQTLIGSYPWEKKFFVNPPIKAIAQFSNYAATLGSACVSLATTSAYEFTYNGGLHVMRYENNPAPNEPSINIDHYPITISKTARSRSYILWKEIDSEHHWPDENDELFDYLPKEYYYPFKAMCKR